MIKKEVFNVEELKRINECIEEYREFLEAVGRL